MDCVEFSDSPLFSQDENHSVMAEAAAGVDWDGGGFVDHQHFAIVHQNLQGFAHYRGLMAVHSVLHLVVILWKEVENIYTFVTLLNSKVSCCTLLMTLTLSTTDRSSKGVSLSRMRPSLAALW